MLNEQFKETGDASKSPCYTEKCSTAWDEFGVTQIHAMCAQLLFLLEHRKPSETTTVPAQRKTSTKPVPTQPFISSRHVASNNPLELRDLTVCSKYTIKFKTESLYKFSFSLQIYILKSTLCLNSTQIICCDSCDETLQHSLGGGKKIFLCSK